MIAAWTQRLVKRSGGNLTDELVVDFEGLLPPKNCVDWVSFDAPADRGPFLVYRRPLTGPSSLRALEHARENQDAASSWVETFEPAGMGPPLDNSFFTDEVLDMMYDHREPSWDEAIREGAGWFGWYVLTTEPSMLELLYLVAPRRGESIAASLRSLAAQVVDAGGAMPPRFVSFSTSMAYPTIGEASFRITLPGMSRQNYLEGVGLTSSQPAPRPI
jgi:hypothetical protein